MSPEQLRVVQVVPALAVGGLERVAVLLTLGLVERGHHVLVCTRAVRAFDEPLRAARVQIELIPRPRARPWQLLRSALALAPIVRRERPDVIHAHNPAAAAAAALARGLARRRGTAIVASYHGVDAHRLGRAAAALALLADAVVAVSPSAANQLEERGLPRVTWIYNGIDPVVERSREEVRREFGVEDAELLVTVGRYSAEKNQALLLGAIAELAPRRPRLRALLVGEGPLRKELQARIEELGLAEAVQLTGPRADAVDIVAAADVFALTSSSEALGIALLEAMSVGCPVVATEVGGVPDFVRDGETGLLVADGDAAGLAEAIERLLDDATLREKLVREGQALVRNTFGKETMVERYLAVYNSAVARRRAR
jgi:glycosyltransferase involved in cell wall biosynthesis